MGKIRELTIDEVAQIRAKVLERFRQRHPSENGFKLTTYRESYTDLQEDIIRVVPDTATSVSLTRLRKLFYYTNPEVCTPDKLEKPSFGKDFLNVLEEYTRASGSPPTQLFKWFNQRGVLLALLVFLILPVAWYFIPTSPARIWTGDEFDKTDYNSLIQYGWKILDYDSAFLAKQPRPGMLALYTLPGDYWVKPGEKSQIKNVLVRPIECDSLDLHLKIVGFKPYQNYQQVGLIFYDKNLDKSRFTFMTFVYSNPNDEIKMSKKQNDSINHFKYSIITTNSNRDILINPTPTPQDKFASQTDTIFVLFTIRGRKCRAYYKHPYKWLSFRRTPIVDLNFDPAFFGIAAYQGWTKDDRTPLGADTIPAYIDWIRIFPIPPTLSCPPQGGTKSK